MPRPLCLALLVVSRSILAPRFKVLIAIYLPPDDYDSPSPFTPFVGVQKQESLTHSNSFPSSIDVSFDIDMTEFNLQTIMSDMFDGDDDDDDDDISISGMELAYPEEFDI